MQNLQLLYPTDSNKISQQKYLMYYKERILYGYWNFNNRAVVLAVIQI